MTPGSQKRFTNTPVRAFMMKPSKDKLIQEDKVTAEGYIYIWISEFFFTNLTKIPTKNQKCDPDK